MHFVALNQRYPQFSFAVQELRPLLNRKGEANTSCVVRFENGVLDTKAQHWTPEEAKCIRKKLETIPETMIRLSFDDETAAIVEKAPSTIKMKGQE